jgi:hypothetical protein
MNTSDPFGLVAIAVGSPNPPRPWKRADHSLVPGAADAGAGDAKAADAGAGDAETADAGARLAATAVRPVIIKVVKRVRRNGNFTTVSFVAAVRMGTAGSS